MAHQFVVKQNEAGGWDVYMRGMVSHSEYRARFRHLVNECGYNEDDAAVELYEMIAKFEKQNETEGATRSMCEDYVFEYIAPGDVLQIDGMAFVVNAPAKE